MDPVDVEAISLLWQTYLKEVWDRHLPLIVAVVTIGFLIGAAATHAVGG